MMHMAIAPSGGWNYPGGTFHGIRTRRNGSTYQHGGIDFAANVGDPIYAMFAGCIENVPGMPFVTGQPNRIGENEYPPGYSGDTENAGNRLWIQSNINGVTHYFGYFHLQEEEPVAINPATGMPLEPGDCVSQGQIIGYVGITGNALKTIPHVHIACKTANGQECDPTPFINGTINTSNGTVSTPCD